MYQISILVGRVGNDVEMRYTPTGIPVLKLNIATNKRKKVGENYEDKTIWWSVTCWQKTAENCAQFLRKGSKVLIVGEVEEARSFTDRAGEHRASLEFTANSVIFLDSKSSGESASAVAGAVAGAVAAGAAIDQEDIPF